MNSTEKKKRVYVRIFLAPKLNQNGVEMRLDEQRLLWSEMDKFMFTCESNLFLIKNPHI